MALDSYDALQASLGRWLKRTNLGDQVQDFITLAEARLNRKLRISQMATTYTRTSNQNVIPTPADFEEAIKVMYNGHDMTFVPLSSASQRMFTGHHSNQYSIVGQDFWILRQVEDPYTFSMNYYQSIPPLSEANQSNWLLEDAPDVYLYAALLEAEPYLKNDGRIAIWTAALATALGDIQSSDDDARFSGDVLSIKAG